MVWALPDEILENIGQFSGNFRLYNGEIITILDKNSNIFQTIERKLKQKQGNGFITLYGKDESGHHWSNSIRVDYLNSFPTLIPKRFNINHPLTNWEMNTYWNTYNDPPNKSMRRISYKYQKQKNILKFEYYKQTWVPLGDDPGGVLKKKSDLIEFVID